MESIITTNLKQINLHSSMLRIETSKGELILDIKQMLKEPLDSQNAYFNATRIGSLYGRDKELSAFMRLKSTQEYIELLKEEFNLITRNSRNQKIRTHYVKRGRETIDNKGTFGTYLHNELFFEYLGWCDVRFKREIHKLFKNLIIHSNELKIERANTKIHFKPLTDAIRDIYIPNQDSDNAKKFAYNNLATLINLKALGMSSAKYRKDNNISEDIDLRDVLPKDILAKIDALELDLFGYIKYANITDYELLKEKLECNV